MNESRIILTNRHKAENRWEEASLFKDQKIKELRATGMHRPEAQAAAWEAMAEKYPPIENPEEGEPDKEITSDERFDPELIANLPSGSLENFSKDSSWVYANIESSGVSLGSAPSAGAVGMLVWARANKSDFFWKILPKALAIQEKKRDQSRDASEKANMEHVIGLRERLGQKGYGEEHYAIQKLKAAEGFEKNDHLGFAAYLRGLIRE
jgi:hypothetical protein